MIPGQSELRIAKPLHHTNEVWYHCKYHPDRPPTLSYQSNLFILPAYLLQKTSRLIRRGVYIRIYR